MLTTEDGAWIAIQEKLPREDAAARANSVLAGGLIGMLFVLLQRALNNVLGVVRRVDDRGGGKECEIVSTVIGRVARVRRLATGGRRIGILACISHGICLHAELRGGLVSIVKDTTSRQVLAASLHRLNSRGRGS